MANTKISALTANTNPTGNEEFVYAYNNANGKITLDTMKTFVGGGGGASITELTADANIWELSEGFYVTTHDLYYKSGSAVEAGQDDSADSHKHMLFVVSSGAGKNSYFVLTEYNVSTLVFSVSGFGKSASSSSGDYNQLRDYQYTFRQIESHTNTGSPAGFSTSIINQVLSNVHDSQELKIVGGAVRAGMQYTCYIDSVQTGQTYTATLGTGVTNPFGVTLPSGSNKKCLIKMLAVSSSSLIITDCLIAS